MGRSWLTLALVLGLEATAWAGCHTGGCLNEMTVGEQAQAIRAKERADRTMTGVLFVGGGAFLGVLGYQFWRERRDLRE